MSKRPPRRTTIKESTTTYKKADASLVSKTNGDSVGLSTELLDTEDAASTETWTPEEVQIVCTYYNVASLDPENWSDTEEQEDKLLPLAARSKRAQKKAILSFSALQTKKTNNNDGNEILDPFGIHDYIFKDVNKKAADSMNKSGKGSIYITSKAFEAMALLTQVHKDTSFAQLDDGIKHLRNSIETRNELLKNLVKTNFGKFKAFYDEMKTENLISSETYGIAPFLKTLDSANDLATSFYEPMLERRNQANKIRTAINILDSWRFLFSLPSLLTDLIKKKKFDVVVREYSKGKYIVESSKLDNETTRSKANDLDSPLFVPESHRKVFDKIWTEVLQIVANFRTQLYEKLKDCNTPIEKQESVISVLMKLDPDVNPAWFYVSNLYKHILESIVLNYNAFIQKVSMYSDRIQTMATPSTDSNPNKWSTSDIKRLFNSLHKEDIEGFDTRLDIFVWKSVQILIKSVGDILIQYLPGLWRVCKLFYTVNDEQPSNFAEVEGVKRQTRDPERLAVCSKMLDNIYHTYGALMTHLFHVDMDEEVTTQSKRMSVISTQPPKSKSNAMQGLMEVNEDSLADQMTVIMEVKKVEFQVDACPVLSVSPPSVWQCLNTHPVVRLWFMTRILAHMSKFLFEIRDKKVGGFYAEKFIRPTVEKLNWLKDQTLESITLAIVQETKELHLYETWALTRVDSEEKISMIIELSYRLYKYSLRSLHRIAFTYFGDAKRNLSSKAEKRRSRKLEHSTYSHLSPEIQDMLRYSYFDALHILLDGLEWLIVNWKEVQKVDGGGGLFQKEQQAYMKTQKQAKENDFYVVVNSADNAASVIGWSAAARGRMKQIDETYLDTRALIILGNLRFIENTMVPKICDIFINKFKLPIGREKENLNVVIRHLDSVTFQNYVRRKMILVHRLLKNGILMSGIDWNAMVEVQEVRPYCHELLLLLVTIHSHVSDICKTAVPRILTEILHRIAEDILLSFRRIDCFNAYGMTQALLEVQFLQDTLFTFSSDPIYELFLLTYELLEKGINKTDAMYIHYKETEMDTAKRYPKRIMESDTFRELIDEKDELLDKAKGCTKIQLMCFADENARDEGDDIEDDEEEE